MHSIQNMFYVGYSPCRLSPCKNGADCRSQTKDAQEYVCTCMPGYMGQNCTGGCLYDIINNLGICYATCLVRLRLDPIRGETIVTFVISSASLVRPFYSPLSFAKVTIRGRSCQSSSGFFLEYLPM